MTPETRFRKRDIRPGWAVVHPEGGGGLYEIHDKPVEVDPRASFFECWLAWEEGFEQTVWFIGPMYHSCAFSCIMAEAERLRS